MSILPLASIKCGKRHRQDHGDIAALARSIEEIGLLHPIVIAPDRTLIAGERRLLAFKQLGRDVIPVTIIPGQQKSGSRNPISRQRNGWRQDGDERACPL